jgi:hypothetical protein
MAAMVALDPSVFVLVFILLIHRCSADFDWGLTLVAGYPAVAFNETYSDSEVLFKYDYSGTLSANKYLTTTLYEDDCETAADSLALVASPFSSGQVYTVAVNINQVST